MGGACPELCFAESVPCLILLEKSMEMKQRVLREVGRGRCGQWHFPIVAVPYNYVLESHRLPPSQTLSYLVKTSYFQCFKAKGRICSQEVAHLGSSLCT